METGKPFPRVKLIRAFLESFEACYGVILKEGFKPIRKRWMELSDIIGRRIKVEMIGKSLMGEVVDIDVDGLLILKDDQGEIHRIVSGDVTLTS
jgi:BirA family biotin operon repressor/biotin-[acetyl-CoA-carboxylase] ligase